MDVFRFDFVPSSYLKQVKKPEVALETTKLIDRQLYLDPFFQANLIISFCAFDLKNLAFSFHFLAVALKVSKLGWSKRYYLALREEVISCRCDFAGLCLSTCLYFQPRLFFNNSASF